MTTPIFQSPIGLFEFQAQGVAECYFRKDNFVTWDTGLGKSVLTMATAALLFEDDLIDHAVIICEQNKLDEWMEDFNEFTTLDPVLYYKTKRHKMRENPAKVFISTYETVKADAAVAVSVPGRKSKKLEPGPFTEMLAGKRVFIAYDEMTKIGSSRTSGNHKAHDLMVQRLRETGDCRVMGLTATPIERSPENIYNLGRILIPSQIGTVAQFEKAYVKEKDFFGNAIRFKNLTADECAPGVTPFNEIFRPIMSRKRKTDADVRDQFPKSVEEVTYVDLGAKHLDFYNAVRDLFYDETEETERLIFALSRQIAGLPVSLVHSKGKMARAIVDQIGEESLRALGSAKLDRLSEYLDLIVNIQGAQAVVFTFYGPSMIPYIKEALEANGVSVAPNHASMSDRDRAESMRAFKAGEKAVYLTSDAGARGINLPQASYAIEYDCALTHAMRTQRLNRISRINSEHESITFQTFIARDTVEEGIARLMLKRNEWSDKILDEDDDAEDTMVTAKMRKRIMAEAKRK